MVAPLSETQILSCKNCEIDDLYKHHSQDLVVNQTWADIIREHLIHCAKHRHGEVVSHLLNIQLNRFNVRLYLSHANRTIKVLQKRHTGDYHILAEKDDFLLGKFRNFNDLCGFLYEIFELEI